ncbi:MULTISPECIES: ABC transporter permease [Microbacterium]|uniref:ABC transporter permease n=1 Tax=Microbacterium wangchenii TaxID=2541726 RepID=A0ABX5SX91_9MICO|nr:MULTISPECIES: ABC transporter permease [Microbacterium]MCK6067346.1 ABC transporter permease [Microbacterium sp. EYE_512]QBR89713.1 ABC transporter permease [Microbacterium wangchenii]TXK16689.1 ABC transporter permease [Microbacterium wangchenii]
MSTATVSFPSTGQRLRADAVNGSPALLALVALVAIFAITATLQPGILSVPGLTLMLMSSVPLVLAAQAQMIIMSVGDIDLGIGFLVGLVTVIAATLFVDAPLLALASIVGIVVAYAVIAYVVQQRGVPSIIITLGMSFVWLGIGLQIRPTPGGETPAWLSVISTWRPTWFPAPVIFIIAATLIGWYVTRRARIGTRMRALGSQAPTLEKAGVSLAATRIAAYVIAAILMILAGLMLASQTWSGDINAASEYTLMTIAAVILGGGTFAGGRAMPIGTTLGAVTLGLITVLLSLINLPSSLQSAAQGLIVIAVLAGRIITERFVR